MSQPYTPRPYQGLITNHILDTERGAVWAGMGLGKTGGTLAAMNDLQLVDSRPQLVIAPLRVAATTWPDEARKWDHTAHMQVLPIIGSERERLAALRQDAHVYTTNFEQLPWLVEQYEKRPWPFRTVIVDESTKLKGFRLRQGTQRAKALARVAHSCCERFIELTGTPSPNGLADLWGQVWFLDKGARLGRTYDDFKKRWFQKSHDGYSVEALPYAQQQIQAALRDLCLTIDAKDWFDLKEPIVNNIYVELPAKARALYEDMEKRMFMELAADASVEALNAAVKTMRCLHIASGFSFVNDSREWREIYDTKLEALDEIIEEAGGMPVLVAYQWAPSLERLKKAFGNSAIALNTTEGLRRAQRGEGKVWLGHPASMGHGVDGLQQHCNTLVYFDHWWNLEERMQILERVGPTRQMQAGHDRAVFVHNLLARKTADELVLKRVQTKREVQDILLEAMKVKGYR